MTSLSHAAGRASCNGATTGCGGGNYCLETPVRRGPMATLLAKTFHLP